MWSEKCDSIKLLDKLSCHSVRKAQLRVPIFCAKHERPLLGGYIPVAFRSRMTALGRSRHHCSFGVTSLIPFCNSRATWSEVNLNPCPSGMRSADTGYLGRRGSMPVILNSSRPVLN